MRRRKRNDEGVSLFPFMSVLASLIGILTLLIAANMVANQKKQEGLTQEEVDRAREFKNLKNQIKELEIENEERKENIEKENKSVIQIVKMKEREIILSQQLEDLTKKDTDETDVELQKRIENLKKETVALQQEQPELEKKLTELKKLIAEKKIQPKPLESVIIRPGGVGRNLPKNIYFVETNSTGVIVRGKEEEDESFTVSTATIDTSDEYARFCQQVFDKQDSMILFLVRKSGNNSYLWGAGFAESKFGVRTGKLPVPNDGEIDLSLFKK